MENPVERAVNEATADTLQMPDQKLMKQVADLVNQRADQSKFAVQAIGKRLMQLRNGKVQALSMELIEYLAFTCETPFYTQIATNDFLQRLNTLLNPQMNAQMQQRLLQVIAVLRSLMQSHQDLFPAFFQFLQKITPKHQIPNNYESKYAVLRKTQPAYSSGARVNSLGSGNSKNDKLRRDLEIVKSNITLTNEIIDNANPQEDASKNEILKDMTTTLRGVEEKLRNLITDMGNNDEGLMNFCLDLNDDLLKTFARYEVLKKHKKPDPFKPELQKQQQQQQVPQQTLAQPQNIQQGPFQQQQSPFTIPPPNQQPTQQQQIQPPPQPKPQQIDLLNLFEYDPQPTQAIQPEKQQNIIDLFDVDMSNPQPQQQQLTSIITQQQQSQVPIQAPPVSQIPIIQSFVQPPIQQSQLHGQPPISQIPQQSNYSALNAFPPQQQYPSQQQQYPPQQQHYPPQQQQYPSQQQQYLPQQQYPPQQNLQQLYQQQQMNYQAQQQTQPIPYQITQPYQQQGFPQQQYPVISNINAQQKKPENEFDNILNLAVGQKQQPQQQQQKLDFI